MAGQADFAEYRNRFFARHCLCIGMLVSMSFALAGCLSASQFRDEADDAATKQIEAGQLQALGKTSGFTIETPAHTLRRRLLKDQNLQTVNGASFGTDQLKPLEHWPDDNYLNRDRPAKRDPMADHPADPLKLTLTEALQIGAFNSPNYQRQKEDVFRTALQLDLELDQFRNTYSGLLGSIFSVDPGDSGTPKGFVHTGEAGLTRKFESGLSLSSRIIVDLAQMLSSNRQASLGIFADISVTLPLLAGAGKHIVTEPLTQAQRNVLYALWSFERFKKTFAVLVANEYLNVLAQMNRVSNAEDSYGRLILSVRRSQALGDAGRMSDIQVNQAVQDMLAARNSWITARQRYNRLVDEFKNTLGLPTDARIELEPTELDRLAEAAKQSLGTAPDVEKGEGRNYLMVADGHVKILPPNNDGAGPLELPVDSSMRMALDHRLDLKIAMDRVTDAQRQVMVAGDALRPGLNLTAGASAGDRRSSVSSASSENVRFRPENGHYDVGLSFDFPWEKTAERNAYRNAVIDLEQATRDQQSLEDQVKLDVRDSLRNLQEARESYRIQSRAVHVARTRVDATNMLLDAGRVAIRDVLEAESSLVTAQNALTSALVGYRVAELQLQSDMGMLEVNDQGLWKEYVPTKVKADDEHK